MISGDKRPTRRQLEVLRAYIARGSISSPRHELGITESTARQHLSGLYRRMGCETLRRPPTGSARATAGRHNRAPREGTGEAVSSDRGSSCRAHGGSHVDRVSHHHGLRRGSEEAVVA